LRNLDAINAVADGIIFVFDKLEKDMEERNLTMQQLIERIKAT
jgi:hypothetical protein